VWIYKRRRREGRTAGAYLVSYGLARFFLEFLRGDLRPHLLGLSAAQCVGLGMVAAGLILLGAGVRFSIRPTATGGQTPCTQD
jgi:phosphatidylglycerol:prolipoprotein diacylglycerol transferase